MRHGTDYIGVSTPFYCIDADGWLLLHRRSPKCRDEHGHWDTGSGQHEPHLTLEQNVLKEISEEYGCQGTIIARLPAHDIFRTIDGVKTHWVAIPHFVRVNRNEARANEPEKMEAIDWFGLKQLPSPLHTGFAQTLSRFKTEFERHIRAC